MTAQIGDSLIYDENEFSIASYPLNQYLKTRPDIQFKGRFTLNHRGYQCKWKIEDNKLYLINLDGTILETSYNEIDEKITENFQNVGFEYVFPEKENVFAEWFTEEIRIPQGEILEYVHHGFGSIYEKDLFLRFENGILVNEYVVDNEAEYQERLKKKEKREKERLEKEVKDNKKETIFTIIAVILFLLVLIGTCIGVFNLIKLDTILAFIISAIIVCEVILVLGSTMLFIFNKQKEKKKQDKIITFTALNFLVLVFIGICIGLYYLIIWGTILAYLISTGIVSGVLYLIFIAIKKRIQNKKNTN